MKMVSIITLLLVISSLKADTQTIQLNSIVSDSIDNYNMKYYSIQLDDNLKDSDLLIDTRMAKIKSFHAPLTLISLNPLPDSNKDKQWLCGQLGEEICFIPNKYLSVGQKVYIGVGCEKCEYNVKASYIKEQILKDGETNLLHLKKGDEVIFRLDDTFKSEKNYINISSFNLKMSNYEMNVENVNGEKALTFGVDSTWAGGKQAKITPSGDYKVTLRAIEDGVFTIEARSSTSIINLDDKNMRFDSLKEGENVCYRYNVKDDISSVLIDTRSIKGDINVSIKPENGQKSIDLTISSEKDNHYELSSAARKEQGVASGNWLICVNSDKDAYFTLHTFLEANSEFVREYKKILYKLSQSEEMYNIDSPLNKIVQTPIRMLVQTSQNAENKGISINGYGAAGVGITIMFLFVVIIASIAMAGIFVNTKFVDTPLLLGKIEY